MRHRRATKTAPGPFNPCYADWQRAQRKRRLVHSIHATQIGSAKAQLTNAVICKIVQHIAGRGKPLQNRSFRGLVASAMLTRVVHEGGPYMARQIVMDTTGDTRHEFDPADPTAVAEAERRFQGVARGGFPRGGGRGEGRSGRIPRVDSAAEETLFFPRLKAG